jgi:predicted dehydrogenase
MAMTPLRIGLIGAGYMGKAHTLAWQSVRTVFDTPLSPVCEMLATSTADGAREHAQAWGWRRSTGNWQTLVDDADIDAVVIATPPRTHLPMALAAIAQGKHVFCEKPLGCTPDESRLMAEAAERAGVANMVGFNYIRTPASQLAHEIIASGEIGEVIHIAAEHVEDYLHAPQLPASWRTRASTATAAGALGDVGAHAINACLRLAGPIQSLVADTRIVYACRAGPHGDEAVDNDDLGQLLLRFASGASGTLAFSRVAAGRKMGYTYRITGTRGALAFDQEDQNALWLFEADRPPQRQGFQKILMRPGHPDYASFNQGPGHGTGYNEQIVIEARDFIRAITSGASVWPDFRAGHDVDCVIAAALQSAAERRWVDL